MNGAVIAGTPISVDFWQMRRCLNTRLFFLSHFHTDHTVGLTSSWNGYKIYCSKQTEALLVSKLRVKKDLVVGLPTGESVVLDADECGSQTITVTLIDAQHCPGSVMFFFEGYFGNILYTADFRFVEDMTKHPCLHGKAVDVLYLDNTYCNPVCEFPSRTDASLAVINIIRRHPGFKVKIGLRHLGKESLLVKIAIVCKCWIGVDPARMETLKLLELPDVFTCDIEETLVNVITLKSGQEISKRSMETWNATHPTIAIIPTALFLGSRNPYKSLENVFVVPYSDHSSYSELVKFVSMVRPRKIIPIVGKPYLPSTMSSFDNFLDRSPAPPSCPIPRSVREYMGLAWKFDHKSRKKPNNKHSLKSARVKKPCGVMFDESPEKDLGSNPKPKEICNTRIVVSNPEVVGGPDMAVAAGNQGTTPLQDVNPNSTELCNLMAQNSNTCRVKQDPPAHSAVTGIIISDVQEGSKLVSALSYQGGDPLQNAIFTDSSRLAVQHLKTLALVGDSQFITVESKPSISQYFKDSTSPAGQHLKPQFLKQEVLEKSFYFIDKQSDYLNVERKPKSVVTLGNQKSRSLHDDSATFTESTNLKSSNVKQQVLKGGSSFEVAGMNHSDVQKEAESAVVLGNQVGNPSRDARANFTNSSSPTVQHSGMQETEQKALKEDFPTETGDCGLTEQMLYKGSCKKGRSEGHHCIDKPSGRWPRSSPSLGVKRKCPWKTSDTPQKHGRKCATPRHSCEFARTIIMSMTDD